MASERGLFRRILLLIDRNSAKQVEDEAQRALRKGTDPKKPKENLSEIDRAMDAIKKQALRLGGVIAGAFALNQIRKFAQDSVAIAAESEKVWSRLGKTVQNAGVDFRRVRPELEKAAEAFQDATTFDDESFAQTLQTLISLTNDYSGSLKNVGLVADVAAKFYDGELAPAAELVGRVMTGQTKQLRALGISTKDATDGLRRLADKSKGEAAAALGTFAGKTSQLANAWENFREELGTALIEGGNGTSVLDTLIASVKTLQHWIKENSQPLADMAKGLLSVASAAATATADVLRFMNPAAANAGTDIASIENQKGGLPFLSARHRVEARNFQRLTTARGNERDIHQQYLLDQQIDASQRVLDFLHSEIDKARAAPYKPPPNKPAPHEETPEEKAARKKAEEAAVRARVRLGESDARIANMQRPGEVSTHASVLNALNNPNLLLGEGATDQGTDPFTTFEENLAGIEDAAQSAAAGIAGAFENAFGMMLEGSANVGQAIQSLGKGMAGALLGGLAQFASGKVKENIAAAIEAAAYALGFTSHGNFLSAAAAWKSAAGHTAAAAAWAAAAGGAGAGRSALGGGAASGFPSDARDPSSRLSQQLETQTIIHIHVDGIDPRNSRHQVILGEVIKQAKRRTG